MKIKTETSLLNVSLNIGLLGIIFGVGVFLFNRYNKNMKKRNKLNKY